ncbi:class I SAM-dependent methyltransferase [Solirubrobacter sp. CPCC 204708]|uniref:Class I SAM-dependent methyltransferase n=1 Tax=Solirubrobacter deserti TaxID=2282478 RepID=A0ABT4RIG1_9ACTN|nr:class I SAM-dependent methyltransferase [Solirubrobacter deserti]MBE2318894.1 class I SAM-dependent methyltransferase [Solirubrobacter deserti]MDA0138275.1 class I SAM-dependent methyltransferase [Solirubrobacter deserti]
MQKERWKGAGGNAWVELQALTDRVMTGFVPPLVDGLSGTVLDVGCGTGATTVAAAQRAERVVGVDISEPMIAAARKRAPDLEFLAADAQTHTFERFDWVISRFGVMFFDDPVAAFANLRRAGARLRCIVWRTAEENPFMTAAERAAKPLLPDLPPRDPHAGQFAFGDPERVRRILTEAGWDDVQLDELDVECAMPASALEGYFTRIGPVGIALGGIEDEALRARVIETVRPAFAPFVHDDEVRYTAACWLVQAR